MARERTGEARVQSIYKVPPHPKGATTGKGGSGLAAPNGGTDGKALGPTKLGFGVVGNSKKSWGVPNHKDPTSGTSYASGHKRFNMPPSGARHVKRR